jgi:hypothetical protein
VRTRIVYAGGVPVAVLERHAIRELAPVDAHIAADVSRALRAGRASAIAVH